MNSVLPPTPDAHFVAVSQKVLDVKVGGGRKREPLAVATGKFRHALRSRDIISGDKLNAEYEPTSVDPDGTLRVNVSGGMVKGNDPDSALEVTVKHAMPLDFRDGAQPADVRGMSLQDVLAACNDVQMSAGGNAQNMIINLGIAGIAGVSKKNVRMTVFSSSDPFSDLRGPLGEAVARKRESGDYAVTSLPGIPDRVAAQMPWEFRGEKGTFGMATEPLRTGDVLTKLLREREDLRALFGSGHCFVATEPLFEQMQDVKPPYAKIINASTAFRPLVASTAYGTTTVLPMNQGEAGDVGRLLRQRGNEKELRHVQRLPLPSPLSSGGRDIDMEALRELDGSLSELSAYNGPFRWPDRAAYAYPITFGKDGGLIVGTGTGRYAPLACFTSTPAPEKERELIDAFGDPARITMDGIFEMGAGDASASVVTLFNALDPAEFIAPHLEGRERENHELQSVAGTVFVGLLSRIAGNFLVRTKECNWSSIRTEAFPQLLAAVAAEALAVARTTVKKLHQPIIAEAPRWGMQVVLWKMGSTRHTEEVE